MHSCKICADAFSEADAPGGGSPGRIEFGTGSDIVNCESLCGHGMECGSEPPPHILRNILLCWGVESPRRDNGSLMSRERCARNRAYPLGNNPQHFNLATSASHLAVSSETR